MREENVILLLNLLERIAEALEKIAKNFDATHSENIEIAENMKDYWKHLNSGAEK